MKNAENLFIALGVVVAIVVGAYVSLPYEMPEDSLGSDPNCTTNVAQYACTSNSPQKICPDSYTYTDFDNINTSNKSMYWDGLTRILQCGGSTQCVGIFQPQFSSDCVVKP